LGPDRIAERGHVLADFNHRRFSEMDVYDVTAHPHGRSIATRSRLYAEFVAAYFQRSYAAVAEPPADLLHVTCTGYVSPSGAQRLVAERGWGDSTRVTHAYHMGCYAAFPALRLAAGALHAPWPGGRRGDERVDIVHTELCSLHLDPSRHTLEQLVVQSLFADGMIRYSATREPRRGGLSVLALDEAILPGTAADMGWVVSDWGMEMTLSRDVPARIEGALRPFISRLYERAGLSVGADLRRSHFAIHPGGPRIVDGVGRALELGEPQLALSREVLLRYGNMSAATLPHIWMKIAEDPTIPPGSVVCSLAFGPGLTLCGGLFEKR
jgi:predicted naringenin-chalcone synthase